MRRFVASFVQRRYRGWKGRARSGLIRRQLRERRRDAAASTIQARVRCRIQRGYYLDLLSERRRISNESAVAIQTVLRGRVSRRTYLAEMERRRGAATEIQRVCRGRAARVLADRMREELRRREIEAKQPKRVPLHLRKYSTYGGGSGRSQNNNKSRRLPHNRRRSSDAMILVRDGRLESLLNERDAASTTNASEADSACTSMASTLTSSTTNAAAALGRVRRTRASQRSQRGGTFNSGSGGGPSWPSAQRVLAARQQNAERRHTTLARPPRRQLDRRRTYASGTASTAAAMSTAVSTIPKAEEENEAVREEENIHEIPDEKADETGGVDTNSVASTVPTRPLHEAIGGSNDEKENDPNNTREITISREATLLAREVIALGLCAFDSAFDEDCKETVDDLR